MSVINQMLNDLEQRGSPLQSGQVRPVQAVRDTHQFKWLLIAALLSILAIILVWRAWNMRVAALPEQLAEPETQLLTQGGAVASHLSFELSSVPLPTIPPPSMKTAVAVLPVLAAVKPPSPAAMPVVMPSTSTPANSPPVKQISAAQLADAEFRKAVVLMQQGRINEALAGYEIVLRTDAGHDAARQALVALLLENKRGGEAEQVLLDGLKHKPAHTSFAMMLARLQVQRNDVDSAITTLENTLPHAAQLSDYQAFYAALLQRKARHKEAIEHYQIALKASPNTGNWLMGYAISLQALSQNAEAKEAYQRALDSKSLSPELQAFVQQKIKGL